MTAIPALLLALAHAGVEVAAHPTDPARLLHRPAELAPDLAEALRTQKASLLALLRGEGVPSIDAAEDDAGHILAERLAIADDLAMATHAGSVAWLVAVGEALRDDVAGAGTRRTT